MELNIETLETSKVSRRDILAAHILGIYYSSSPYNRASAYQKMRIEQDVENIMAYTDALLAELDKNGNQSKEE